MGLCVDLVAMKKIICGFLMMCGAGVAVPVDDGMYATLQTTMGDVCFELYYTNVPQTVANFVSLAEGTRPWIDPRTTFVSTEPYYDGSIFHRVVANFMIQCGSPQATGKDGPGYTFEDDFDPSLRHDRPGTVSMANSGFDSNGGQFFITVTNTPWLDDVHSVFGSVVEGMEVVSNIAAVATNVTSRPLVDVVITNAFITRNGTPAQNFSITNQALPEVSALPMTVAVSNGLQLATDTADTAYQFVYASTNLTDWSEGASRYWALMDGAWNLTASLEDRAYFHANRVVYTLDTNMTIDVVGHRVVATIGTNVFDVSFSEPDAGLFFYNGGTEQPITYMEWSLYLYHVQFRFQASGSAPFWFDLHYTTPTAGRCVGYYYYNDYFGWQKMGKGTFTDQDLN